MFKEKRNIKKTIHFIGIGGIGMSGIAELMLNQGYRIQGSDISTSNNVKRLKNKKIRIFNNHSKKNLKNVDSVVYSSAIKNNNPEIKESKRMSIPLVSRAEMLAELMRFKRCIAVAGSHGKTTTTSLIGSNLEKGKKDPTIINGGIINSISNNNRMGTGKWMVVEADESDGSFLKLPHQINVITNIDKEHLDYYQSLGKIINSFEKFATNIPFYGYSVICLENANTKKIVKKIKTRNIITYGYQKKDSDVNIIDIKQNKLFSTFTIILKNKNFSKYKKTYTFKLNLLGKHNILNATASIIVSFLINIPVNKIKESLINFQGVKRRFTYLGNINKCAVYDDYAHHPTEIKSSYQIAKILSKKKIIVVFQPHRYSRTKDLYKDFVKILKKIEIIFVSEIYSAGEKSINKINTLNLIKDIKKNNNNEVHHLKNKKNLNKILSKYYNENNLIVFMGAGSISQWANELVEKNEL